MALMVIALIAALLASLATLLLHVILGGRDVAGPLLANASVEDEVKYTSHYCWHLVSITLAAITIMFGHAVYRADPMFAVAPTALAGSFAAWSLTMIRVYGLAPLRFPQWFPFLLIAAAGAVAIAAR